MTSSPTERMRSLVDALYDRTLQNKLSWRLSFDESAVEAKLATYIVRVNEWRDEDGDPVFVIEITNDIGNVIDIISGATLRGLAPPKGGSYGQVISEIYRLANRQIKGADKAIDDILSELKEE